MDISFIIILFEKENGWKDGTKKWNGEYEWINQDKEIEKSERERKGARVKLL